MVNHQGRRIIPLAMIILGSVFIVGSAVWLIEFVPTSTLDNQADASQSGIPFPEMPRVSLEEAKNALDKGEAIFVDVRGEPYYSEKHIPGALSVPEEELPARALELNKDEWIITYCT